MIGLKPTIDSGWIFCDKNTEIQNPKAIFKMVSKTTDRAAQTELVC